MKNRMLVRPDPYLMFLVLLLLSQCQTVGSGGLAFGFVDFNKVMEESLILKEITNHSEQLIKAYNTYEQKQYEGMGKATAKEKKEIQKKIKERRTGLNIALKTNNNKIYAHQKMIRKLIETTAKKRGYDFVALSEMNMMLVSRYVDFTDDIIKIINRNE